MENDLFKTGVEEEALNNITKLAKAINGEEELNLNGTEFKPCNNVLPEKTNFWTKLKNALFYEIKVELSPYEKKVEDEINDFLHQEVTFAKVKGFLFQEVKFR